MIAFLEGPIWRAARAIIGIALIVVGLLLVKGTGGIILAVVGVVLLATAALNVCIIAKLLGGGGESGGSGE